MISLTTWSYFVANKTFYNYFLPLVCAEEQIIFGNFKKLKKIMKLVPMIIWNNVFQTTVLFNFPYIESLDCKSIDNFNIEIFVFYFVLLINENHCVTSVPSIGNSNKFAH